METFMNFLTSSLGQDILGIAIIALTGGSGAALVAAKKLLTANNINKGIVLAVDAFSKDNADAGKELKKNIKEKVGKHNDALKKEIVKVRNES